MGAFERAIKRGASGKTSPSKKKKSSGSSARAILGGKDVARTTRQTRSPAPAPSVSAVTGAKSYRGTRGRSGGTTGSAPVSTSQGRAKPSKPKRRRPTTAQRIRRVRRAYNRGDKTLPGLDAQQTKVASKVLKTGLKRDATKKELLSAAETGLVESNFRNLPYGAEDSQGWRQERTSIYGTGPKGARNVKASAKRYFKEVRTDPGTQDAPTPGLLAQAAQGSAFPERYDQREREARRIVKAYTKGKKAKNAPKQKPGPWKGAQKAVIGVVPKGVREEGRGDKRSPGENDSVGGSSDSDHLTTNDASYAADLPANDKVARRIAKKLGLPSHTGTQSVVRDGYRYQLIWQDSGHFDHIHLGARWVGSEGAGQYSASSGGTPAIGGTSAPAIPSGGSGGGGAARAPASGTGASARAGRRSRRRKSQRKFLEELLDRPPIFTTPQALSEAEARKVRQATRRKVRPAQVEFGI